MLSQIATTADARAVQSSVPRQRFRRYTSAADGSLLDAARLYVLDAEMRGAALELIHFAEVALRDAFHKTLAAAYGQHWFQGTNVILDDRTLERFADAQGRITTVAATPDRIIAEVSLGGWGELLEIGGTSTGRGRALAGRADYESTLWDEKLEVLFAGVADTRLEAAALVRRVRRLRNRVAHHESVLFGVHQPGERDAQHNYKRQLPTAALSDVRTLIAQFCPNATTWLQGCTHAESILSDQLATTGLARVRANMSQTTWL